MSSTMVIQIATDLLLTVVLLSLPAVLTSLVVGVGISVLQTVTSIQEQTLSFAPRILASVVVIVLALPWMLQTMTGFTHRMMLILAEAGR